MKKMNSLLFVLFASTLFACNGSENKETKNETSTTSATVGQSGVQDDASQKNVVQVAISSKDHTTLVVAIKAGELVDALSNAGPFTVFAPTNEAFNKLPAGTVNDYKKAKSLLFDLSFFSNVRPINLQMKNLKVKIFGIK